jgi:glycosyltransferase involved in cell wall biosynthesis
MKILALQHKVSSVFRYRIERPLSQFALTTRKSILRINDVCTIEELGKRFKRYGNIWVMKYIDDRHTLDILYSMRNAVGAKIVVDIDDNIWQIPKGNIARGSFKEYSNRAIMMIESVKAADWVTVSTQPLKEILSNINQNIAVLPNFIDPEDWKTKRKVYKKVRIGWVWSPTHIPDMEEVTGVLKKISKRDDVEIVIFGTNENQFDFPTTNVPAVHVDKYPETFQREGIDISIAPLKKNDFNECKSDIKFLESTMTGASFIGSKVYPYEHSVKEGVTGYLADNPRQWERKLISLIENEGKRKEFVERAREHVLCETKTNKKKWKDFYDFLATDDNR